MNFILKTIGMMLQIVLNLFALATKKVKESEVTVTRKSISERFADMGEAFKQGRDAAGYKVPDFKGKNKQESEFSAWS